MNDMATERQQAYLYALAHIPYRVSSRYTREEASAVIDHILRINPDAAKPRPPRATPDQIEAIRERMVIPRNEVERWSQAQAAYAIEVLKQY